MISLYFLLLSWGSYTIFLLLIPSLLTSSSWVPLVRCLFDEVRPSFDRSGHRPRQGLLQPIPLHPPSLFLLLLRGGVTLEAIMAQLEHMDARFDTLTTELYQVNTCVSHITWRHACMGGFITSPSPSSSPQASKDKDDDNGSSDGNEDEDASSSCDEEMTASQ